MLLVAPGRWRRVALLRRSAVEPRGRAGGRRGGGGRHVAVMLVAERGAWPSSPVPRAAVAAAAAARSTNRRGDGAGAGAPRQRRRVATASGRARGRRLIRAPKIFRPRWPSGPATSGAASRKRTGTTSAAANLAALRGRCRRRRHLAHRAAAGNRRDAAGRVPGQGRSRHRVRAAAAPIAFRIPITLERRVAQESER